MTAIAAKISKLIGEQADGISWENLSSQWQQRISSALINANSPNCLVFPHTPQALSEILAIANASSWRILSCGSGSKLNWGGLADNIDLVVSTQKLNGIIDHAVGDLTITVESGVKLADLQAAVTEQGQFLPLDPSYSQEATIGGILATADAGSWRQRYGGVRDMVLGVSFVRSDGQIAKAGGRVVKNVAGYDLMKLLTGSYGTLGVICQVTLRLYPLPETSTTVVLTGEKDAIASASQTLLNSTLTPTAADLLSPGLVKKLDFGNGIGLMIRFESVTESVKEQATKLVSIGQQLGLKANSYSDADETTLWQPFPNSMNSAASDATILAKIGILPTASVHFLDQFSTLTDSQGFARINVSSGIGKLQLELENGLEIVSKLRSHCQEKQGYLTILESPTDLKQKLEPWGYSGNALEIMKKIKQKFDPNAILNPGRFVGKI